MSKQTDERKRIYLWGAGKMLPTVLSSIKEDYCFVLGVIDGNLKKKNTFVGDQIKVITPDDIAEPFDYIVITVKYPESIVKKCEEFQIPSDKRILFWTDDIGQYDFIDANFQKIGILEEENRILRLKLENYPYEHGYEQVPTILPACDLLNLVIGRHKSLCRFGDGEFELAMMKSRPKFQDPDLLLSKRLKEVLRVEDERVCIALADDFGSLDKYTDGAANAIREYIIKSRDQIMDMIDMSRSYYDAYVSRPYMMYRDKTNAITIFGLFQKLFSNQKLLVVEGKQTRNGCNNDLFRGAKQIRRIICPNKNSFDKYEKIVSSVLRVAEKDELILISLGPTATVLAYDLCMAGLWAIDLGQIDNEYEWYIRREQYMVPISGKTVSDLNYDCCTDDAQNMDYLKEIVAIVD